MSDGVDPTAVPVRVLASGDRLPALGLGTFGSDTYNPQQVAAAVEEAAGVGYRHFDCAAVYGNEREIGGALDRILRGGLIRKDLWITSKVWNDRHEDVVGACQQSLHDLGLEYLDLFLVHWPFPNHHAVGVDVGSRDPHAVPYLHERYMRTWRQMESLVTAGLVRNIGVSNMTIPKLQLLLADATIRPAVNQMELHPHFQQPELFQYLLEQGIVPVGFSPIGSPSRPERDRTREDTVDVEDPVIVKIAARLDVHPAVACVKWALQRGQAAIPFSVKRHQFLSMIEAVVTQPLTDEDMREIASIDKGCRLIKGQVFLWPGSQSWQDLWDPNGVIPS